MKKHEYNPNATTTPKQRILFTVAAILLLFTSLAAYILVIMSNGKSSTADSQSQTEYSDEEIAALNSAYIEAEAELEKAAEPFSGKYFEKLTDYKKKVKSFNAISANSEGLKVEDIKEGSGAEITADSTMYGTYYIGWCSDETVFDSSFDNYETPTKLKNPLIVEKDSLIPGWYQGVAGMRLGGARIVTIPGELAYGESYNPCDPSSEEKNVPLKFLIIAFDTSDEFKEISKKYNTAYKKYLYALYGMKYEEEE